MNVIIDTNIILSAIIKDSLTRHLIISSNVLFYYPEQSFDEVLRNKKIVLEKTKMPQEEFNMKLITLFKYIDVIKNEELLDYAEEADKIIGHIHKNDVPFIAAALAKPAIIWSNDQHFQKQDKIRVITTNDIINYKKLV